MIDRLEVGSTQGRLTGRRAGAVRASSLITQEAGAGRGRLYYRLEGRRRQGMLTGRRIGAGRRGTPPRQMPAPRPLLPPAAAAAHDSC